MCQTHKHVLPISLISLFCLLPTVAAAQTAGAVDRWRDARDAFESRMDALREKPDSEATWLAVAESAEQAGRWHQAIMAWERLLELHPNRADWWERLAKSYAAVGDDENAKRVRAWAREHAGGGDSEVAQAEVKRFFIGGKLRVGFSRDTNANQGPSSDILHWNDWLITVPGASEIKTNGMYASADVNWLYRPENWTNNWAIVGDASASWRGSQNNKLSDAHNRTSQYGRVALGLRHASRRTLVDVRVKRDIFDYNLWQHVDSTGVEGMFLGAVTNNVHLIFRGSWEKRNFSRDWGSYDHSGNYRSAGVYGRFIFGAARHEIVAGIRTFANDSDLRAARYQGEEPMISATFRLPHGVEVTPFYSYTTERYKTRYLAVDPVDWKREDHRTRKGLSLTWRQTERLSWEMNYQRIDSNVQGNEDTLTRQLYSYDRELFSVGVAYAF
jgi:hypothetical protein